MSRPIISWSFSVLDMFGNCPRKFWAVRIAKVVSDANKFNLKGDDEHKCFDRYLKKRTPLPEMLAQFQPVLDRVIATPGELYSEYAMALDNQYVPCSPTAWDSAWVRANADVLIVNGERAKSIDWKTGKIKRDERQLRIVSALIFQHFPSVNIIDAALVFLHKGGTEKYTHRREDIPTIWNELLPKVAALEKAKREDNWPATPNPLCGWCPYKACPHNTNPEI